MFARETEQHLARVVHVHIGVDHDDDFREHHLSHAPQPVHHLHRVVRELFLDRDDDEIVKRALGGQRHVDDFVEVGFEHGQEDPHAGGAHVEIFHRRHADDRARINRVAPMRDALDVKLRIRLGQGVITRVIAERAFEIEFLLRLNVAFQDKIAIGGHFEIVRVALHHLDGFLAEETREHHFVDAIGQRRRSRECVRRVAPERRRPRACVVSIPCTAASDARRFCAVASA